MEFRLNKIDTNVRRKLDDKTCDGKIHKKKDLEIYNKDCKEREKKKNKKKKDGNIFKNELKKASVTINALKSSDDKEKTKDIGNFIDVKK